MTVQPASRPAVLLLGNYRPCLPAARALRQSGYRVIVTRGASGECCEFSRHVDECFDHPPLTDMVAFFRAVGAFLTDRPDIAAVLPIWEPCVELIGRYRYLLPADRLYATPADAIVALCLNKPAMLDRVAELSLPVARYRVVHDIATLRRAAGDISYPVIIRPVNSKKKLAGRKALIVPDPTSLLAVLHTWPAGHRGLIVQRFVEGPRINVYFAARHGRPLRYLATRIDRTDACDGTGYAVDGVTIGMDTDLEEVCNTLIAALDYTGIGLLQFIRDARTGDSVFLELNPRVSGSHAVPESCAMNLSRLAIDLAAGTVSDEALVRGPAGRRYTWLYGDLSGLLSAVDGGDISKGSAAWAALRAVFGAATASIDLSGRLDDPLPVLALIARKFGRKPRPVKPAALSKPA